MFWASVDLIFVFYYFKAVLAWWWSMELIELFLVNLPDGLRFVAYFFCRSPQVGHLIFSKYIIVMADKVIEMCSNTFNFCFLNTYSDMANKFPLAQSIKKTPNEWISTSTANRSYNSNLFTRYVMKIVSVLLSISVQNRKLWVNICHIPFST